MMKQTNGTKTRTPTQIPQAIITRCETGNATALWLRAWPELEADSYDAYSALCVPDDSVLLLRLYQLQNMCSIFTSVSIFPSSSDWEEARSPLSVEDTETGVVVADRLYGTVVS